MRLLELLQGAVVKTTRLALLLVVVLQVFVEAITDALAESVNASVAARLGLLVADSLVVVIRVVSLCVWCQTDHSVALGRHLSGRAVR